MIRDPIETTQHKKPPRSFLRGGHFFNLGFQVDAGLLGEDVADVAGKVELHVGTGVQRGNLGSGHVHGGHNQHHVTTHGGNVQVHSDRLVWRLLSVHA